jgi:hypothetical protein
MIFLAYKVGCSTAISFMLWALVMLCAYSAVMLPLTKMRSSLDSLLSLSFLFLISDKNDLVFAEDLVVVLPAIGTTGVPFFLTGTFGRFEVNLGIVGFLMF